MNRESSLLARCVEFELLFCQRINRRLNSSLIQTGFAIISRLGDGILWYSIMLCLPLLYGIEGLNSTLIMTLVGVINLTLYKLLKKKTCRARPYQASDLIVLGTKPLDHYSFPSGHTLHAVAFTIILVSHYPYMGWIIIPFSILVAMSRVILGLHYPTDVIAGAILGTTTSLLALSLF
jgi:undecaprenyl-diphosphatase